MTRWLLCPLALLVTACGSANDGPVCDSSPKFVYSDETQRTSALVIIRDSRELRQRINSSSLSTGFWGSMLQNIPGTRAAEAATQIKHLRWEMANQKAQELAWMTDGKSGLPSGARWACDLLAGSVAALDMRLSRGMLLDSLQQVEKHYRRVYEIFGGKELERDLKQL